MHRGHPAPVRTGPDTEVAAHGSSRRSLVRVGDMSVETDMIREHIQTALVAAVPEQGRDIMALPVLARAATIIDDAEVLRTLLVTTLVAVTGERADGASMSAAELLALAETWAILRAGPATPD